MRKYFKKGVSFGITSGIITTLGLMVGLNAATSSKIAVVGGIVSIAVADALSDAMGVHMMIETENVAHKHAWESTFSPFISKFFFAVIFLIPILLMQQLKDAVYTNVLIGLFLIVGYNYSDGKYPSDIDEWGFVDASAKELLQYLQDGLLKDEQIKWLIGKMNDKDERSSQNSFGPVEKRCDIQEPPRHYFSRQHGISEHHTRYGQ